MLPEKARLCQFRMEGLTEKVLASDLPGVPGFSGSAASGLQVAKV